MERLGYENKYEILNAMDFGISQKRERIFVIRCLEDNQFSFENMEKKKSRNIREFIDQEVSELYEVKQESMLNYLRGEPNNPNFKGRLKVINSFTYTICTKQVRVPNSGIVEIGNGKYRYLTERECLRPMGFEDEDADILEKAHPRRKNCMSSILYKQAGNSVVVDVLESILREIEKISF